MALSAACFQPVDLCVASPTGGARLLTPAVRRPGVEPTPGLERRHRSRRMTLHEALMKDSVQHVQELIEEEPEAAWLPFCGHLPEPPLCMALRLRCSLEVLDLLLANGADPSAEDAHGRTSLTLVSAARNNAMLQLDKADHEEHGGGKAMLQGLMGGFESTWALPAVGGCLWAALEAQAQADAEEEALRAAGRLLAWGADPEMEDGKGQRPAEVASANGYLLLERLWAHYRAAQALFVLRRGVLADVSNADPLHVIFSMLLPPDILDRVWRCAKA
mmetsp:Transcript_41752/g.121000  ORF Transcript_41752/g.121000 Transcript_41752/m.121000 type:complete len:275 (-) Transcript_41752:60-884(-)